MPSPASIETVGTGADKAKLVAAALSWVGAVVAFYLLSRSELWLRVTVLGVLLALGVLLFLVSEPGRRLIAFGRESVKETRKVVWPTGREALQNTGYVFAFVFIMALFLWITDKSLEWVLYDLILGWKR